MTSQYAIELVHMRQLEEATGSKDDWTGIRDARERRKRQNRLNQRAFRKRKTFEGKPRESDRSEATAALAPYVTSPISTLSPTTESSPHQQQATTSVASISFHQRSNNASTYFPLTHDHELLNVIALNVSRAVLTNYSIISLIPSAYLSSCCSGLRTFQLPQHHLDPSGSTDTSFLPTSLTPTRLQQQVPHLGWIDLFPSPQLRDNLILAFVENRIDEDSLVMDLLGGIFDGMDCGRSVDEYEQELQTDSTRSMGMGHEELSFIPSMISEESSTSGVDRRDVEMPKLGLISWSDPWDISGWEITDAFARKWGFLLKGCADVVTATNMWRDVRGDDPLLVDM